MKKQLLIAALIRRGISAILDDSGKIVLNYPAYKSKAVEEIIEEFYTKR